MNTKRIGNIGEGVVLSELVKMGIPVYIQFGDNEAADFIIIINTIPFKIQVKTSTSFDGEKTSFDLTSSTSHRKNGKKHKYSCEEVDMFFCYDVKKERVLLIENKGYMSGVVFRYTLPKNKQVNNINFANQHTLCVETLHEISNKVLDKEKVQTTNI